MLRIASEIGMKITPACLSSALKVVATETESNTASTAIRELAVLAHHALQHLLFAQRNAELLVSLEDLGIDFVERLRRHLGFRRGVVIEILIVDRRIIDARPIRLGHGQPAAIGIEPPCQHPFRLALLRRDEADDVLAQPLGRLIGFDVGDESVFVLVDIDEADLVDGFLYGGHL